ncbi:hypothetical protein [Leptospira stimsonii]|uniref:Uncharacterized protein n=1 Tax=Leptospira stimsonii TaxID=2202203 RepID=A0ABY2MZN6_9LEPT|nr:hypothetical protein [Leptospira stimsonii]TGK15744.1 hypothetical protein EHO98_14395 [Leptospira stimsonii]TGM12550.1 hypothetical protein EHQ90_15325 [Leptospira stimsonii]
MIHTFQNIFIKAIEDGLLNIVIHSNSFKDPVKWKGLIEKLESVAKIPDFKVQVTPCSHEWQKVIIESHNIEEISYQKEEGGWCIATSESIRILEFDREGLIDPVVSDSSVYRKEIGISRNLNWVLIVDEADSINASKYSHEVLNVETALSLCRLFSVFHSRYKVSKYFSTDETGYYLFRFKTRVPSFQFAWAAACKNSDHEHQVFSQLDGLSTRLRYLFKAQDQASIYSLLPANNSTFDNALYHFAYMSILAAGITDDIAWLFSQVYGFSLKPKSIALPKISTLDKKLVGRKFLQELKQRCPEAYSFLCKRSTLGKISLIHAIRDTVVHRRFAHGHTNSIFKEPGSHNRFHFDKQISKFIRLFDSKQKNWGIGIDESIELFQFTENFISMFVSLVNKLLFRIDWVRVFPKSTMIHRGKFESEFFREMFSRELRWPECPAHF